MSMNCFECHNKIDGDGVKINLHHPKRYFGEILKPIVTICQSCAVELGYLPNNAFTGLATPSAMDEGLAQNANQ